MYTFLSALLWAYEPQDGDIIFQTSNSSQSEAIQLATQSRYSHVGIVYIDAQGHPQVYEASGPVGFRSLKQWIKQGENQNYTVMRPSTPLDRKQVKAMKTYGAQLQGRPYDHLFRWSDTKMYCSELVWKIYYFGAGIVLSTPRRFEEYNFESPHVKETLKRRWGDKIRWTEKVVAPSDLADSPLLKVVEDTF